MWEVAIWGIGCLGGGRGYGWACGRLEGERGGRGGCFVVEVGLEEVVGGVLAVCVRACVMHSMFERMGWVWGAKLNLCGVSISLSLQGRDGCEGEAQP